jgi:hypothetical protein
MEKIFSIRCFIRWLFSSCEVNFIMHISSCIIFHIPLWTESKLLLSEFLYSFGTVVVSCSNLLPHKLSLVLSSVSAVCDKIKKNKNKKSGKRKMWYHSQDVFLCISNGESNTWLIKMGKSDIFPLNIVVYLSEEATIGFIAIVKVPTRLTLITNCQGLCFWRQNET